MECQSISKRCVGARRGRRREISRRGRRGGGEREREKKREKKKKERRKKREIRYTRYRYSFYYSRIILSPAAIPIATKAQAKALIVVLGLADSGAIFVVLLPPNAVLIQLEAH